MEKEKLSEEDILVGVGNHIISKLSGRAITTRKKSQHKCPCGCAMKLDFGEKMYIGKLMFFDEIKSHFYTPPPPTHTHTRLISCHLSVHL